MKKGVTNNPNGRPAGSANRITKELRKTLKAAIDNELEQIPFLMQKLEPKDRLEILVKLLPYTLPKIETQSATHDEPIAFDLEL